MKWKKWAKSWLCNYTSKQYFHYVKMPTLDKHVPSFNNQSKTFTHLCLALSHFIMQLWFVWVSLYICANHYVQVCQKQRCQLDRESTERDWQTTGQKEKVFVHRPLFHAVLNCFSSLEGKNVKGESENVKVYKQSLCPVKGPSTQVEDMKPNLRFASNLVIWSTCPFSRPI